MPSLSAITAAEPMLPPSSEARALNVTAPPKATGSVTGTDACQTPDCGVPDVRTAATPFTVRPVTPTASDACTVTSNGDAAISASAEGETTTTAGGVASRTV